MSLRINYINIFLLVLRYRDRAKERRQKYGEDDSPPPNRSKERFQRELEKQQQVAMSAQKNLAATPIGENNVGNRLLQKMGWSEGQGLGRSNQGRTNIIEVRPYSFFASVSFSWNGILTNDFVVGGNRLRVERLMLVLAVKQRHLVLAMITSHTLRK